MTAQTRSTTAVPLLVRPHEAARMLGVGRSTLYELMAAGVLRSVRIGRARRVPVEALHEYVASLAEQDAA